MVDFRYELDTEDTDTYSVYAEIDGKSLFLCMCENEKMASIIVRALKLVDFLALQEALDPGAYTSNVRDG